MIETHDVGLLLGMDSEEVPRALFHLTDDEHNYCQIVRTPGIASEKDRLLAEHKKTIEVLLDHGARHAAVDMGIGERTYTGGRLYFRRPGPGRLAYHRGRGLAWREWDSEPKWSDNGTRVDVPLDNPRGEWLSDVGLIPEGLSVVK